MEKALCLHLYPWGRSSHVTSKTYNVLTERGEGAHHEPYTWTNNYGKGVFHTAYGHDEHTWKQP